MKRTVVTIDQLWQAMIEQERDAMVQSRQLPMWFVILNWDGMTWRQQKSCISHQRSLSSSFYVSRWVEMIDNLQREAIRFSRLPEVYVAQCWATTKQGARTDILCTMTLSESTCEVCWAYATDLQKYETKKNREDICRVQQLSMQFIETHWEEMTEWQKRKCYVSQHLTPEFALRHWQELDETYRKECVVLCIKKATIEVLPSFITSADSELRQSAIIRMGELLTTTCYKGKQIELPDVHE